MINRFLVVLGLWACGWIALAGEVVWSDDTVPAGAWTAGDGGDVWTWITANPAPHAGTRAHQSSAGSGIHYQYFMEATARLTVNAGETLFSYVYLDPANPPQEVMLRWFDGSSWSHAAYWGANVIIWGANGTPSQYPAGPRPPVGQWVRLEVPASAVGLEGQTLSGMQFIVSNGRATWDYSGKASPSVSSDVTAPTVAVSQPASGAVLSGATLLVATATDSGGVAGVQFKLDGAHLGAPLTTPPYVLTWDTTIAVNGAHVLTAVAWDAAGQTAAASAVTLQVGNGSSTNAAAAALPNWIGGMTHNWKARLGGVYWLDSRAVVKQAAPYLTQSARPVLVNIKSDATGYGYRFDLDTWDSRTTIHPFYAWDGTDAGTPASPEDVFNIFGATGNAEFILNLPIPLQLTSTPTGNWGFDGHGYLWQTAAYYAAMTQYLFGEAGPPAAWQTLPLQLDYFSQPAAFNWANLRARRGHVQHYPVAAVIIGEEPYNLEGTPTGALYGIQAEKFRVAIRGRGVTVPLGLHVRDMGIVDDPLGGWFHPMMANLTASDFSFIDLEHYYQFSTVPEDFKRVFPVSINPRGFQGWWLPKSAWKSDYTKFLWIVEDTRNAIRDLPTVAGLGDPNRWQLGFSEHGVQIVTQFSYNDMFSAMNWAGWLAESMRQNIVWDSGWTLLAEGYSTAALQSVNGQVTRTPMFFVYQMAQEFYGLDYLSNSYVSPMGASTSGQGEAVQYPLTSVRTFRDPVTDQIHLFVVNQSTNSPASIPGFENWKIVSWKQLAGPSFASGNPLGVATPEPIQTVAILPASGHSLAVAPISVNHIVLAAPVSTNALGLANPTMTSLPSRVSQAGNYVKITWNSSVGKVYHVASKSNLSDPSWANLSGPITAAGATTTYLDAQSTSQPGRYYIVYAE